MRKINIAKIVLFFAIIIGIIFFIMNEYKHSMSKTKSIYRMSLDSYKVICVAGNAYKKTNSKWISLHIGDLVFTGDSIKTEKTSKLILISNYAEYIITEHKCVSIGCVPFSSERVQYVE